MAGTTDQEKSTRYRNFYVTQSDMALQGVKERHGRMGVRLNDSGGYSRRLRGDAATDKGTAS